jgi:hypothetical protein
MLGYLLPSVRTVSPPSPTSVKAVGRLAAEMAVAKPTMAAIENFILKDVCIDEIGVILFCSSRTRGIYTLPSATLKLWIGRS